MAGRELEVDVVEHVQPAIVFVEVIDLDHVIKSIKSVNNYSTFYILPATV